MTQNTPADAAPPATGDTLRVDLLTREYPPERYGCAGVRVEYLARELRPHVDVRVHGFGGPRDDATAMGEAGRRRAVDHFSWRTIAERTVEVYRSVRAG